MKPTMGRRFFFTWRTLFPLLDKKNTRDKAKGLCITSERHIGELGTRCLSTLNRGQDSRQQSPFASHIEVESTSKRLLLRRWTAIAFGDKHPLLQLGTHYCFAYTHALVAMLYSVGESATKIRTLWCGCPGRVFSSISTGAFRSNSREIKISMQVRNGLSRKYHTFLR